VSSEVSACSPKSSHLLEKHTFPRCAKFPAPRRLTESDRLEPAYSLSAPRSGPWRPFWLASRTGYLSFWPNSGRVGFRPSERAFIFSGRIFYPADRGLSGLVAQLLTGPRFFFGQDEAFAMLLTFPFPCLQRWMIGGRLFFRTSAGANHCETFFETRGGLGITLPPARCAEFVRPDRSDFFQNYAARFCVDGVLMSFLPGHRAFDAPLVVRSARLRLLRARLRG